MKERKGIEPVVCKGKACRIDKTRLEKDRKSKSRLLMFDIPSLIRKDTIPQYRTTFRQQ